MRKFEDFSVIQILRETSFGESESPKTAVFAISRALNFVNLVNFSLQKVQKLSVEMADFALSESPKLISRKILVIEKS